LSKLSLEERQNLENKLAVTAAYVQLACSEIQKSAEGLYTNLHLSFNPDAPPRAAVFNSLSHSGSRIRIFIEFHQSYTISLVVGSSDTIQRVKETIMDNECPELALIDLEWTSLSFENRELQHGRTLADYNIQKDSTLYFNFDLDKPLPKCPTPQPCEPRRL
jgi:hypothetical protein